MYNGYANTWNQLRLRQMFPELEQSQNQAMPQQPQQSMETDPYNPLELEQPNINVPNISAVEAYKSYQPQMAMQNRFAQEAGNPPNRSDFQPSAMRRIGAALAGFAGSSAQGMWGGVPVGFRANPNQFEDTQRILDQPYNEALVDYKSRIDPLRAAADDERMANTVQSNFLDRTVNRDIQERNLNRLSDWNQRQGDQKDRALDQANRRVAAYEKSIEVQDWIKDHPSHVIKQDDNGLLIGINPKTNEMEYIVDSSGNPVKGSDLPDRTRIELQIGGALQNTNAKTAGAIAVKETPPPAPAPVTTESTEEIKDAQGNVIGTRSRSSVRGPQNPSGPLKPENIPPPPPGMVRMRGQDGKTYVVPQEKLREYSLPPYGMVQVP